MRIPIGPKPRGVALFFVLAICGVLALYTGAVGLGAIANLHDMANQEETDAARYSAMGGIQSGLCRLSTAPKRPGPEVTPPYLEPYGEGVPWSDVDYYLRPDLTKVQSSSDSRISAIVQIYNNTAAAFHRSDKLPDGTPIPAGKAFLISAGVFSDGERKGSTTLGALVKPLGVNFEQSAVGRTRVDMTDCIVDVADTGAAGWTTANYTPYDMTASPRKGAQVASNNKVADTVKLTNTRVDGSIRVGPGSAPGTIGYYSSSSITDGDGVFDHVRDLPVPQPPSSATPLSSLTMTSASTARPAQPLAPGTYDVAGGVSLSNVTLTISGPTVIYVHNGDVSLTNVTANTDGKPARLQIFCSKLSGAAQSVSVRGCTLSGLITASKANVFYDDSEQFGAVMGETLTMNNSKLHYDPELKREIFGSLDWVADSYLGHATTLTVAVTALSPSPTASATTTASTATSVSSSSSSSSFSFSTSSASSSSSRRSVTCLDYSCGPPRCMLY